jgi:hypothetical protein
MAAFGESLPFPTMAADECGVLQTFYGLLKRGSAVVLQCSYQIRLEWEVHNR